jgi:hypothetical protein
VRDPKDPRARVPHLLLLAKRHIEPEKHLLRRFLRLRRVEAQREQVAIDVLAEVLEQPRNLVPQRRITPLGTGHSQQFFPNGIREHYTVPADSKTLPPGVPTTPTELYFSQVSLKVHSTGLCF